MSELDDLLVQWLAELTAQKVTEQAAQQAEQPSPSYGAEATSESEDAPEESQSWEENLDQVYDEWIAAIQQTGEYDAWSEEQRANEFAEHASRLGFGTAEAIYGLQEGAAVGEANAYDNLAQEIADHQQARDGGIYQVAPGDTLSGIAARYGVKLEDVLRWNPRANPNLIYPGETIYLPSYDEAKQVPPSGLVPREMPQTSLYPNVPYPSKVSQSPIPQGQWIEESIPQPQMPSLANPVAMVEYFKAMQAWAAGPRTKQVWVPAPQSIPDIRSIGRAAVTGAGAAGATPSPDQIYAEQTGMVSAMPPSMVPTAPGLPSAPGAGVGGLLTAPSLPPTPAPSPEDEWIATLTPENVTSINTALRALEKPFRAQEQAAALSMEAWQRALEQGQLDAEQTGMVSAMPPSMVPGMPFPLSEWLGAKTTARPETLEEAALTTMETGGLNREALNITGDPFDVWERSTQFLPGAGYLGLLALTDPEEFQRVTAEFPDITKDPLGSLEATIEAHRARPELFPGEKGAEEIIFDFLNLLPVVGFWDEIARFPTIARAFSEGLIGKPEALNLARELARYAALEDPGLALQASQFTLPTRLGMGVRSIGDLGEMLARRGQAAVEPFAPRVGRLLADEGGGVIPPELPIPRPEEGIMGRTTVAYGPDPSKAYSLQYRLIELDDVIPSHTDAFAPNPSYPKELQPRMRERGPARLDVERIAQNLSPGALLDESYALDRGSAIVGRDMVIESGNGRILALRKARSTYPTQWEAYQAALAEALPQFGLDPARLREMRSPILVRERLTDVDRVRFAAEANQPAVAAFSPMENALQDAKGIRLDNLVVPDETQSLDATLRMASNRRFIVSFLENMPINERGALVDTAGELNVMGMQRIKAAMFARTYPGEAGRRLTNIFFEVREPIIRNVENGIMASLPKMAVAEDLIRSGQRAASLSVSEDLAASMDMLARLKQRKMTVAQYLGRMQLWERELTPFQEQLLEYIEQIAGSPRQVREFLGSYADNIVASPHPQQATMFEGRLPTKEGLFNATVRQRAEGPLFAQAEVPPIGAPEALGRGLVETPPGIPEPPIPRAVEGRAARMGGEVTPPEVSLATEAVGPPLRPGYKRLYRGEPDPVKIGPSKLSQEMQELLLQDQERRGLTEVFGRWFTDDPENVQWYLDEARVSGPEAARLLYIDVPAKVAESFRVPNLPASVQRWSAMPQQEFFLPRELLTQAKVVDAELGAKWAEAARIARAALEPPLPRAAGEGAVRAGRGWKIHLNVLPEKADPLTRLISQWLDDRKISHKVGHSGGQEGKGMTIYVGKRADLEVLARELDSTFGSQIPPAVGVVLIDDEQIMGNIWGRFDISLMDKDFTKYGHGGVPYLKTAASNVRYGTLGVDEAWRRSEAILRERYGEAYRLTEEVIPRIPELPITEAGYRVGEMVNLIDSSGNLLSPTPMRVLDVAEAEGKRWYGFEGTATKFPEEQLQRVAEPPRVEVPVAPEAEIAPRVVGTRRGSTAKMEAEGIASDLTDKTGRLHLARRRKEGMRLVYDIEDTGSILPPAARPPAPIPRVAEEAPIMREALPLRRPWEMEPTGVGIWRRPSYFDGLPPPTSGVIGMPRELAESLGRLVDSLPDDIAGEIEGIRFTSVEKDIAYWPPSKEIYLNPNKPYGGIVRDLAHEAGEAFLGRQPQLTNLSAKAEKAARHAFVDDFANWLVTGKPPRNAANKDILGRGFPELRGAWSKAEAPPTDVVVNTLRRSAADAGLPPTEPPAPLSSLGGGGGMRSTAPPPSKPPTGPPVGGNANNLSGATGDLLFGNYPEESLKQAIARQFDGARNYNFIHTVIEGRDGHTILARLLEENGQRVRRRPGDAHFNGVVVENEVQMEGLRKALHGEGSPPPELRELYDWLIARRDEEFARMVLVDPDFAKNIEKYPSYFYRAWRLPKGDKTIRDTMRRLGFGDEAAFEQARVAASYEQMRAWGFTPLSNNPVDMVTLRRIAGDERRAEIIAVQRAEAARLLQPASQAPKGWRVPRIGGEGSVFSAVPGREAMAVPNELAGRFERIMGVRPAGKGWTIVKAIVNAQDRLKQYKFIASFFQHFDILSRLGYVASTLTGIRNMAPLRYIPLGTRLMTLRAIPASQRALRREIASDIPMYDDFAITGNMIIRHGLNVGGDPTMLARPMLENIERVMASGGVPEGWASLVKRRVNSVRDFSTDWLFSGVYSESQWWSLKNFVIPKLRSIHPDWKPEEIAALAAEETNKMFSTIGPWQSWFSSPESFEVSKIILFSGEFEAWVRQAAGLFKGQSKTLWAEYHAAMYLFLAGVSNLLNYWAEGEFISPEEYSPVKIGDRYSSMPGGIAYNTRWFAPKIAGAVGGQGRELFLDTVGQADTVLRWMMDPVNGSLSRLNVFWQAGMNQWEGRDFWGRSLDTWQDRLGQLIQDVAGPIGPTSVGEAIRQADPDFPNVLPTGEVRAGVTGNILQGISGMNIRTETNQELRDRLAMQHYGKLYLDLLPGERDKEPFLSINEQTRGAWLRTLEPNQRAKAIAVGDFFDAQSEIYTKYEPQFAAVPFGDSLGKDALYKARQEEIEALKRKLGVTDDDLYGEHDYRSRPMNVGDVLSWILDVGQRGYARLFGMGAAPAGAPEGWQDRMALEKQKWEEAVKGTGEWQRWTAQQRQAEWMHHAEGIGFGMPPGSQQALITDTDLLQAYLEGLPIALPEGNAVWKGPFKVILTGKDKVQFNPQEHRLFRLLADLWFAIPDQLRDPNGVINWDMTIQRQADFKRMMQPELRKRFDLYLERNKTPRDMVAEEFQSWIGEYYAQEKDNRSTWLETHPPLSTNELRFRILFKYGYHFTDKEDEVQHPTKWFVTELEDALQLPWPSIDEYQKRENIERVQKLRQNGERFYSPSGVLVAEGNVDEYEMAQTWLDENANVNDAWKAAAPQRAQRDYLYSRIPQLHIEYNAIADNPGISVDDKQKAYKEMQAQVDATYNQINAIRATLPTYTPWPDYVAKYFSSDPRPADRPGIPSPAVSPSRTVGPTVSETISGVPVTGGYDGRAISAIFDTMPTEEKGFTKEQISEWWTENTPLLEAQGWRQEPYKQEMGRIFDEYARLKDAGKDDEAKEYFVNMKPRLMELGWTPAWDDNMHESIREWWTQRRAAGEKPSDTESLVANLEALGYGDKAALKAYLLGPGADRLQREFIWDEYYALKNAGKTTEASAYFTKMKPRLIELGWVPKADDGQYAERQKIWDEYYALKNAGRKEEAAAYFAKMKPRLLALGWVPASDDTQYEQRSYQGYWDSLTNQGPAAWRDEFELIHGRRPTHLDYRDYEWSQDFLARYGRGPTRADWVKNYWSDVRYGHRPYSRLPEYERSGNGHKEMTNTQWRTLQTMLGRGATGDLLAARFDDANLSPGTRSILLGYYREHPYGAGSFMDWLGMAESAYRKEMSRR